MCIFVPSSLKLITMPCPLKKEISKIVREEVFSELQRIHKEQKKWDLTPEEMDLLNMEDKAHHFRLRKDTTISKTLHLSL